ncbi:30S ribosomal protein S20 [candidate division KSB1 bacterium]|nr:30S ribosomal protein S20 [candidate division KSB1 bacterium]
MPHHKSTMKRVKTNLKSQQYNRHYKSMMKSSIKKVLNTQEKDAAEVYFKQTQSLLDKLARKNVIHANKAANQKRQLANHLKSL